MPLQINDNIQSNSPKPLNNKIGKFVAGAWQPFDTIEEAQIKVPLGARYKGLIQFILKDGVPTEYWYLIGTANDQLIEKFSLSISQINQLAQDIVDANNILMVPTPSDVTFNNPNRAIISADGTQILNNYDRYTGVPFNATKVINWYDGTLMDDSKVDGAVYFKVVIGGVASGYAMRNLDYEKSIDPSWWGMKEGLNTDPNLNRTSFNSAGTLASVIKGKVVMPKGVFYTSGGSLQFQNDVLYDGAGQNSSIWRKVDSTTNAFLNTTSKSNFIIRNIGFNGGIQTQNSVSMQFNNCSNFTVEYCRFTNMKNAIWMNSSSSTTPCHDFKILFNQFDSVVDFGVRAKENSPYNGLILGNTFENVTAGIAVGEYSAIRVSGINIKSELNTIKDSVDTGIMITRSLNCSAINNDVDSQLVSIFNGTYSIGTKVHGNTLSSVRDYAIHAYNPPGEAIPNSYGSYIGNTVTKSGKSSIRFEGSSYSTFCGNILKNPGENIGAEDRDKCCVLISTNTGNEKSDFNIITGNIGIDDRATKRMKYVVFVESANTQNKIFLNTTIGSTSEEVRISTNTYLIGESKIIQSNNAFQMSLALGVGESTTLNLPDAVAFGRNKMLFNIDSNRHTFSNGTSWLTYALLSEVITSIIGTTNQVIVTNNAGIVTLALPQDVASSSSPMFAGLNVDKPAGQNKDVILSSGGLRRWTIRSNSTAESGSNAGSDLNLIAAGDDGAVLGTVISIVRSTQVVTIPKLSAASPTFTGVPLAPTAAVGTSTTQIASTAFVQAAINSRYVPVANTTDVVTKAFLNTTYPIATFPIGTEVDYYNQGMLYKRATATIWTETPNNLTA